MSDIEQLTVKQLAERIGIRVRSVKRVLKLINALGSWENCEDYGKKCERIADAIYIAVKEEMYRVENILVSEVRTGPMTEDFVERLEKIVPFIPKNDLINMVVWHQAFHLNSALVEPEKMSEEEEADMEDCWIDFLCGLDEHE